MAQHQLSISTMTIISINVNSIVALKRRAYMSDFLKKHKPDVLLICETKLNKHHNINFKDYNLIRTDRRNSVQGGGTAILIKNCYAFEAINSPVLDGFECLESTGIWIRLPERNRLYILSMYAPRTSGSRFSNELQKMFEGLKLDDPSNYYIIAGDINAKHANWLNSVNNPRGVFLSSWIVDNAIGFKCKLLGSTIPTYPAGDSYLDICIADSRLNFRYTENNVNVESNIDNSEAFVRQLAVVPYDSDHNAILMRFSYELDAPFVLMSSEKKFPQNYQKTNWLRFKKHVEGQCRGMILPNNQNMSNGEIDYELEKMDVAIRNSIEDVVPKIKPMDKISCLITPQIKSLQRHKSFLISKLFHVYRHDNNYHNSPLVHSYKSQLNNVKTLLKQQFKNSTEQFWRDKINGISHRKSTEMFPNINRIFRKKSKVAIPSLSISIADDILIGAGVDVQHVNTALNSGTNALGNAEVLVSNEVDKLNIIGLHFERIHQQNNGLSNVETITAVNEKISEFRTAHPNNGDHLIDFTNDILSDSLTPQQTRDYFTTLDNLREVFSRINNKKSAGMDSIPNIVLKHLPEILIRRYCILFNNALNNRYFPKNWKRAKVYPIEKKNKESNRYDSYRPIGLLPNIGKIYEVIINQAIQTYCDDNHIIPDCQFGFRRFHSTVHAITKFASDCCWHLNAKKCIGACLIDLEKAFDTVWQDGLIYKLIQKKFPDHITQVVSDMISDKCFVVTNGECTTERTFTVANGLQQGTVNSPILFNIFISDLLQSFNFNADANRHLIAFADDLIIYSADSKIDVIQRRVQLMLDDVLAYLHRWKLRVNPSKCETILIRTPLSKANRNVKKNWRDFSIFAGGDVPVPIAQKSVVRYLGLNIDQYLYYTDHLKIQLAKANNAFMLLRRLFFSKHLSADVKVICYKTLVRPILTYGAPIWYNMCASYMERLRVFERKALRSCTGRYRTSESQYIRYISNRMLYNSSNTSRIDMHIIHLVRNHFARTIDITDNDYVCQPYYPNDLYLRKTLTSGFIPPEAFLLLDREDYIQNRDGVPVIYHIVRRPTDKKIVHSATDLDAALMRYSTDTGDPDPKKKSQQWWQG